MRRLLAIPSSLLCLPAFAHIEMSSPTPRFNDGNNKWCPCGTGGDGSRANDGCELSASDPNRGPTSNTFAPGATVTVRWRETIGHTGRFRISFDPDGADQSDFDSNILLDIPDPSGSAGNTGNGNNWEATVTLPHITCSNCTLQLVQVMNGNTSDPVFDLTGTSSYFQCANLVLAAEGESEGEGEGKGEGEDEGEGNGDGGCAAARAEAPCALVAGLALLAGLRRMRHAAVR